MVRLKRKLSILLAVGFLSVAPKAKANDMEIFLKSCAYGTAAGAVLGLASLALSEDPSEHRGNIARGASLGLYAGIGFGLYTLYGMPAASSGRSDFGGVTEGPQKTLPYQVWFSSITRDEKIDGAQINFATLSF